MSTIPVVRVKDTQLPVSVFVYELQSSVVLSPGKAFNADHPVVLQAPWAFYDDTEEIETATAEPGKRRRVTKATAKSDG